MPIVTIQKVLTFVGAIPKFTSTRTETELFVTILTNAKSETPVISLPVQNAKTSLADTNVLVYRDIVRHSTGPDYHSHNVKTFQNVKKTSTPVFTNRMTISCHFQRRSKNHIVTTTATSNHLTDVDWKRVVQIQPDHTNVLVTIHTLEMVKELESERDVTIHVNVQLVPTHVQTQIIGLTTIPIQHSIMIL